MRNAILPVIFAALVACTPTATPELAPATDTLALQGAPEGALVASVNQELITAPLLEAFARSRGLDPAQPEQRGRALEALIDSVVLAQLMLRSEQGRSAELQAELTLARLAQLSSAQLAHLRSSVQVSEQQLRDYYEQEAQRAGDSEYHIAHILFAEEAMAVETARRAAEPGVDFEAIMQESAAAGALQARDLGWGNLAQMPETFPEVLGQLQDGQVAPVPVQSSYGWHVLQRIGTRPFERPAFELVREGARTLLVERALAEQVKALRSEAQVQQTAGPG